MASWRGGCSAQRHFLCSPRDHRPSRALGRPFLSPSTWRPHSARRRWAGEGREPRASGTGRSDFCSTADHVTGGLWVPWACFSCGHRSAVPSPEGSEHGLGPPLTKQRPLGPPSTESRARRPASLSEPLPTLPLACVCSWLRSTGTVVGGQDPWSSWLLNQAFPAPGREERSGVPPWFGASLPEGPDKRPQSSLGPGASAPLRPISGDAHQPRLPFGGLQGRCSSWPVTSGSFPADLPIAATPGSQHGPGLPERSHRAQPGRARGGPGTVPAPRRQMPAGLHCGAGEERGDHQPLGRGHCHRGQALPGRWWREGRP